jgi:hypothetical protein
MGETKELRDVEILRTGKWNGHEWTEAHLDEAVRNFNDKISEAQLLITKDGTHEAERMTLPGGAALGFVSKMWRSGQKLFANFKQIPKKIAELIHDGALKLRSIEAWLDYETADDERHGRVIDGVLFFGDQVPAVHGVQEDAWPLHGSGRQGSSMQVG